MAQMTHKYPVRGIHLPRRALTDIALAMRIDPQFASLAKDLVIMGGYVDLHLLADYQVGYHEGSLQDRPAAGRGYFIWQPQFGNVNVPPGIRKVMCVFEVDAKKPKHRILHSLQYPKT
ncbi:hypothetical protein N7449_009492 [Penicillium cf. viridicatum]|uniref:Uncharacterized protein n=1 Tax=Penicillium cf. viridicatum TaxID=2972119 RepID=A0A9W9JE88_9EURO|nr:hypothetical protein N7449_009492 [Penicillium cf. viridicatum]